MCLYFGPDVWPGSFGLDVVLAVVKHAATARVASFDSASIDSVDAESDGSLA